MRSLAIKGPRWCVRGFVSISFAFVVGCAGRLPEQTGIDLPPEPVVKPPVFVQAESPSLTSPSAAPKEAPPGVAARPTRKEKGKPATKVATPPAKVFEIPSFPRLPFQVGERMVIDLHWMALPAGRVVMEVRPAPPVEGRPVLHLWGNVLSSKLVDAIYHVDNTVESFIDAGGAIPYRFLLHMVESSQKKETRVVFDHRNEKALYWSKRISQKWGDEQIDVQDALVPGAKDMYSGLYFLRLGDYELNKEVRFPVYEKSKNLEVVVTPVANELVNGPAGIFQCWKLLIQVSLNNNLQQTGQSFLWVSDDSKRYIVKFDAKVKIGSLRGQLVELRDK